MLVRGRVINVNPYGATVRLDSGEIASAPIDDVSRHRAQYERSLTSHKTLDFDQRSGKRPSVIIAPQIRDDDLETHITGFLRESEERLGDRFSE